MTPPPGFSTPPQIPNNTTSERPPVITNMFVVTTPQNTPFAYHASTLANPNHIINPAFVEANYEVLESFLRERQRHIRNENLRTELEYFSEDYNEEREMEPRPEPNREVTPTLRLRHPVVRRQRERVMGFKEAPNREGRRRGRNAGGIRPLEIEARKDENRGVNLPPLLVAHFGRNKSGQPLRSSLTSVHGGHQPSTNMGGNLPPHDPDCRKTGSILNYEDLKAKSCSHFSQQKKFTKTHLVVHNIKQREGESTRAFVTRYTDDTLQILGLHEEQRISSFVHGLRTRSLQEKWQPMELLMIEGKTLKDQENPLRTITEDRKAGIGSPHTEDLTTDCFPTCPKAQERSLPQKRQLESSNILLIEEAVKSGQLFHLVKGIKKERVKASENQRTKGKKDKSTMPVAAPILMIRQDESYAKNKVKGLTSEGKEITFPLGGSNSSALVVIKAKIFGREVNRVHMDGGSSCEVKEGMKKVRETPPANEKGVFSYTTSEEKL
ncbi:hypothetical protein Tco_1115744, partial [Tanacetum coccineum]